MDAAHHEKIVDKLMQYRGKIPKDGQLGTEYSKIQCAIMRNHIDNIILIIDGFALNNEKGLIR